ncbi:hypothetical protein [Enterocloster citroniae]|uniref:Uncharacterized protein n=1 Tax=[Clostridium] citroniae WAL-17108 TaxID=742733 RepID=G5HES1_9FIRM|nr:hypothetical protein [Enterocloster citroniae]EHF00030.1 hypothetical protein HMPREF9469_00944 [ [[Clostridium] citroniae WAL-17108]MCC3383289.1 hypothetical protein [Enterocloster citroniae]DAT42518.1 MAG TPA: hypothetical protein [Caudoviricetes sp.]
MKEKLLTLDNLYEFFLKQNKDIQFCAKTSGSDGICVQVPAYFSASTESAKGLMPVHMKVCHTKLNRNNSFISEENMNKALPSLFNRPILGHIIVNDDGVADFHAHDMEINEDDTITYIERPVGVFPESCNARLEYDSINKKTYVLADGYVYEDYGNQAASILRKSGSKKMSCELVVNEFSFNAKDKYLEITDFYFNGATILGTDPDTGIEIGEGMVGSEISIESFSKQNNSHFSSIPGDEEKYNCLLERLNQAIMAIEELKTQQENLKGGENLTKFDELLAKYDVDLKDIEFEYEGLTDTELEAAFAMAFDSITDNSNMESNPDTPLNDTFEHDNPLPTKKLNTVNNMTNISFELSHEDIRYALYKLIEPFDEMDNDYYYISAVYNDYFAFEGWASGRIWGQKYTQEKDNISLDGERYELYKELLTASEKAELESMRSNYSVYEKKLNEYELNSSRNEKLTILKDEKYSVLTGDEAFKTLTNDIDNYSVKELEDKAKILLAEYVLKEGTFSYKPKTTNRVAFNLTDIEDKPYGSLFDDLEP